MHPKDLKTNQMVVERLEQILKQENPCNIKVKGGVASCRDGIPCCGGCRHLSAGGCQVVSVACKFYFCPTAWESLTEAARTELEALGKAFKGPLKHRYSGPKLNMKPPFVY